MLHEHGDAAEWLRFARSDLAFAILPLPEDGLLSIPCFHAQQAAEKSIKAVLLHRTVAFPRTHIIEALIDLLPSDCFFPEELRRAAELTEYAASTRYPGGYEEITESERQDAIALARGVVRWAEHVVAGEEGFL